VVLDEDAALAKVATEFGIEFVIAKTDGCSFRPAIGKDNALDTRPVGRRQTHGAGLAGGIQGAAGQMKVPECRTSRANGTDFSMSCRVVAGNHPVPAFGHDAAFTDDYGTKRATIAGFA